MDGVSKVRVRRAFPQTRHGSPGLTAPPRCCRVGSATLPHAVVRVDLHRSHFAFLHHDLLRSDPGKAPVALGDEIAAWRKLHDELTVFIAVSGRNLPLVIYPDHFEWTAVVARWVAGAARAGVANLDHHASDAAFCPWACNANTPKSRLAITTALFKRDRYEYI